MSAWAFALEAWRRPGVERLCLDLQDRHGQCVALLLWRLWAAGANRRVAPDALAAAVAAAKAWEGEVVGPLRRVRRTLKSPSVPVDAAALASLRESLSTAEVAAERCLTETLERLAPEAAAVPVPPLEALVELARAWGDPPPEEALARLAAAF